MDVTNLLIVIGMITYPDKKRIDRVAFKLNSDDFSPDMIRTFGAYLRSKELPYKYHRTYSQTKIMSWGCYTVKVDATTIDWKQNKHYAEELVNECFPEAM